MFDRLEEHDLNIPQLAIPLDSLEPVHVYSRRPAG